MRLLIGTSGYSYAPWKGVFYPEKLPAAEMLTFYAGRFPTVEINNTFYRMPDPKTLERWATETPDGFVFGLKSPKRITHDKRLADADDSVKRFWEVAASLGGKLGPILFQLPPFLRKDLPRLEAFLAALPPGIKAAFEFRHTSWFTDDVYAALRTKGAALCAADTDEEEAVIEPTTGWGYLRLRRQDYDDTSLTTWAKKIRGQSWQTAYVYFKHEDEGRGPKLAERLIQLTGS